jgi:hypothetical protein
MSADDRPANLAALRGSRERRVNEELFADLHRQALPNAVYWVAVVGGSFIVNLLLLLVVTRT